MPMVIIFGIFYLLLIRPQQKRQREHEAVLKTLTKGDRVVTTGGLHGQVVGESEEVLTLDVGAEREEILSQFVDGVGVVAPKSDRQLPGRQSAQLQRANTFGRCCVGEIDAGHVPPSVTLAAKIPGRASPHLHRSGPRA